MYVFKKLRNILNKHRGSNWNVNMVDAHTPSSTELEIDEDIHQDIHIPLPMEQNILPEFTSVSDQKGAIEPLESVPSVYVDAKILEQYCGLTSHIEKETDRIIYEINGSIFHEDIKPNIVFKDYDKLLEFDIIDHTCEQNDISKGIVVEQGTQNIDLRETQLNSGTSELPVTIQNTPYGLIINSNILLTENGWNTIICGDNTICLACNRCLDIIEIADHIATDNHKYILDKLKPLEEFDMNIVRKINDKYHCAICNVTFDIDNTEHLESEPHGEKLLTSINKLSDITQIDQINMGNNENGNRDNDCIQFNNIVEDSSGFDSESFEGFYDDVTINYSNDNDFEIDEKDNNQETDQNLISYADMAKKPKPFTTPKYVQIKFGDKYAKVAFDSWHMVIILKPNYFYCMACKESGPIRYKSEHCVKVSHVENLMKCNIVRDYKEHVIRKVDQKLYHCGHCNNLHMTHEIRDHIETKHSKRSLIANINITEQVPLTKCTLIRSASQKKADNSDKNNYRGTKNSGVSSPVVQDTDSKIAVNTTKESDNFGTPDTVNQNNVNPTTENIVVNVRHRNTADVNAMEHRNVNNENHNLSQINTYMPCNQAFNPQFHTNILPVENNRIIVREFGHMYNVSLLAYHLVQQRRPNEYFCWICDMWCTINVLNHTVHAVHTAKIARTGFWPQTSFHLIRQTKYGFHCVICQILMPNNPINHTWDPVHLGLLNRAIYITPSTPMTSYQVGVPIFYENKPTTSIENSIQTSETKNNNGKTDEQCEGILENTDNERNNKADNDSKVTETDKYNGFDTEEYLYVKVKNVCNKITRAAYNSLVQTGNGARYCALCSVEVFFQDLEAHVSSPEHLLNMEKCKFLNKYEKHLVRQMSTCYHCALCNVCIIQNFLHDHISWPAHKEIESNKIVKHIRRNEIKSGVKEIRCETQNQIDNHNMANEFEINVNIEFRRHSQQDIVKRNKIVIIDDAVLKLSWDSFHGVSKSKIGYKCLICQTDFKSYELSAHIESARHLEVLENCFQVEFLPAIIRKVNGTALHCLTCNVEVNNEKHAVNDHIDSKRHAKKYAATVADKTVSDMDNNDVLILNGNDCTEKKKKH